MGRSGLKAAATNTVIEGAAGALGAAARLPGRPAAEGEVESVPEPFINAKETSTSSKRIYSQVDNFNKIADDGLRCCRFLDQGHTNKMGFSEETSREVIKGRKGRLSTAQLIRHRVRHFTQGLALGSREWVERVFVENRESFGLRRKTGARRLRDAEAGLFALRDLKSGD